MRRIITLSVILSLSIAACNSGPVKNIDWSGVDKSAMVNAMSQLFVSAAETAKPSVLYAEIFRSGTERYDKTNPANLFVFSPDGYLILPNYNEPKDIDRIKVWIDETEYEARFIDADKEEDITVLKVQVDSPLRPLTISDNTKVLPGQYVIGLKALGEEMHFEKVGQARMVTAKIEGKNDRILTDTSGGSEGRYYGRSDSLEIVTNMDGEFIGVSGGGGVTTFNRLKQTAERLIAHSTQQDKPIDIEESQPWEGFGCDEMTKEFAEAWGYPPESVRVRHVSKISPAGQAGLKKGDVVIAVDGQALTKKTKRAVIQFSKLSLPEIGRTIKFTVLRSEGTTATAPKQTKDISFKLDKAPKPKEFTADDIGLKIRGLAAGEYEDYDVPIQHGVLVADVIGGSSAATGSTFREHLIWERDIITEFYGQPIKTLDDFIKTTDKVRAEKPEVILVKVQRQNRSSHICLNLKIGKRTEKKED
ncbi:MAG: PDZ domain-containing protein [Candidatus Brocadiia bacterium]